MNLLVFDYEFLIIRIIENLGDKLLPIKMSSFSVQSFPVKVFLKKYLLKFLDQLYESFQF